MLSQASFASLNYVGPTPPRIPSIARARPITRTTPLLKSYQWSFSMERQFGGAMAQAAYVGNHGTNLSFPVDFNQVPGNLLLQSALNPGTRRILRPYPQFSAINGNTL